MRVFTNVLEEIVVGEIHQQIEDLKPELQTKVRIAEVTAYTLNRLPPLFATSINGWKYQYDYGLNEFSPQIEQLVRRGFQIVLSGDPLHDMTPLPRQLFMNSAGVLHELSQILGKKYLRWRDVPIIVQELVNMSSAQKMVCNNDDMTIIQGDEETQIQDVSHLSRQSRYLLSRSQKFISKQANKKQRYQSFLDRYDSWADEKKSKDALDMEYRALKYYTLQPELGMVNVLEHLVLLAIEKCSTTEISDKINHSEVAAYALNRLPAMYATSVRGFRYLRQKAISELSHELIGTTRNGILKVMRNSKDEVPKIHVHGFNLEYEQAIVEIRLILQRGDIHLLNIVDIVQQLMNVTVLAC
jgi:hypothetical protein